MNRLSPPPVLQLPFQRRAFYKLSDFTPIPQNMFTQPKPESQPEKSLGRSLLKAALVPMPKERLGKTALHRYVTGGGASFDGAPPGQPAAFSLTAKQKYGKHFAETDLRVGNVCMLCGHTILDTWAAHEAFSMHRMAMSVFAEIFENHRFRSAKAIQDDWMAAALIHNNPNTIHALVSLDIHDLRRQLHTLVRFLGRYGILKESVSFVRGRTFDFDQAEWLGDVAIPPLVLSTVARVFDFEARDSIWRRIYGDIGFLFGNPHLEATFDFLGLRGLIEDGQYAIQGKTKSDFVETLAGELQMFLLGAELDCDALREPCIAASNQCSLYQLADHTLHVLAALIFMSFLVPTVGNVVEIVQRINAAEGCDTRRVPVVTRVARTVPLVLRSRRVLRKRFDARNTASLRDFFALSAERQKRKLQHPSVRGVHVDTDVRSSFSLEEPTSVLPILVEDEKLYDSL